MGVLECGSEIRSPQYSGSCLHDLPRRESGSGHRYTGNVGRLQRLGCVERIETSAPSRITLAT
jgi:hypothetical protein